MINQTVTNAVNDQIKHELDSAYLYLSMSAYCESINLGGFAHWMREQFEEEMEHAMRLYDYLHARGGRVMLPAIDKPQSEFGSPLEVFQQVLQHENHVTELINNLYALAVKENDYATQVELQWFIAEQVEEEKTSGEIVEELKLIGDSGPALHKMNRQLGKRGMEKSGE
ncbi:MAG: ferritin [bacterium]